MKKVWATLLLGLWVHGAMAAESLTIAAAADLANCLDALSAAFRQTYPDAELKTTTGASGSFFAQIKNGAPFDVFLSADMNYPRELVKAGLADEASLTRYATGHIVLWTLSSTLAVEKGLDALASANVGRVAIANPDVAPYGRAARAALQAAGLWDSVQSKLVFGENIGQTAQFVRSGNVDAGIVALSFVKAPGAAGLGRYYEIPEQLYPTLEQGAVIPHHGQDNPLAQAYIAFLRSPAARVVFDRYGFVLPAGPGR